MILQDTIIVIFAILSGLVVKHFRFFTSQTNWIWLIWASKRHVLEALRHLLAIRMMVQCSNNIGRLHVHWTFVFVFNRHITGLEHKKKEKKRFCYEIEDNSFCWIIVSTSISTCFYCWICLLHCILIFMELPYNILSNRISHWHFRKKK